MIAALVLSVALSPLQEVERSPFDRVIELTRGQSGSEQLGFEPVECRAEFDGLAHLWVESPAGVELSIEGARRAVGVGYAVCPVTAGDVLLVRAASSAEDLPATLQLHWAASIDGELARARAEMLAGASGEAARLAASGEREAAQALRAQVLEEIAAERELQHSEVLARALESFGREAYFAADPGAAESAYERALAHYTRTRPAHHADRLDVLRRLGVLRWELGRWSEARGSLEEAMRGFEATLEPADPSRISADNNLAAVLNELGEYGEARRRLELVLPHLAEGSLALQHCRVNLSNALVGLGDLGGALGLLEQAVAALRELLPADAPDLLRAELNLVSVMVDLGDTAGARALDSGLVERVDRALPAGHVDRFRVRLNLADTLSDVDPQAAVELAGEAAEGLAALVPADHPMSIQARSQWARTLQNSGRFERALELYREVLAAREKALPAGHITTVRSRGSVAWLLLLMGRVDEARPLVESTLAELAERLPADHPDVLRARLQRAHALWLAGEPVEARAEAALLTEGMSQRAARAVTLSPRQVREAIAAESERLASVLFLSTGAGPELQRAAFELVETLRATTVEAARVVGRANADPGLAPLLARARSSRRALNDAVASALLVPGGDSGLGARVAELSAERDRSERELAARLAVQVSPVRVAAIARALDGDSAFAAFRSSEMIVETEGKLVIGERRMLAHVVRSDGSLTRIDLGEAGELEALVASWRAAIGEPLAGVSAVGAGSELRAGRALRERVIDPIVAAAGDGARTLHLCPDDFLHLIAFDALPLAEAASVARLGDRYRLVQEVSAARLVAPPADEPRPRAALVVLGGANYDVGGATSPNGAPGLPEAPAQPALRGARASAPVFAALSESGAEARAVAQLFGASFDADVHLLEGARATKGRLFELVRTARFVHLATHGWVAPESIRSTGDRRPRSSGLSGSGLDGRVVGFAPMTLAGLALAGANRGRDERGRAAGILTAEELCSYDLAGCELAVLSGCETNVGVHRAGQGIHSLQAALYAAGVRTSVTSLWKVDDAATSLLMEAFYRELWERGRPKSEALWRAKSALRAARHPARDWMGWVLVGDPE